MNYVNPYNEYSFPDSWSDKELIFWKQSFFNHLEAINDLCFDPNREINQSILNYMKHTNPCTYYLNLPFNYSISMYASNNKYIDYPEEGNFLGKLETSGDIGFIKSSLFKNRIFDAYSDIINDVFASGTKKYEGVAFFANCSRVNSYDTSPPLIDSAVPLEVYLKVKIERNILKAKSQLAHIVAVGGDGRAELEEKISVMSRHLDEVNRLDLFKGTIEFTAESVKRTGIDGLINIAKQRTNSNVTNSRPRNIENRSPFSRDYI